MTTVKIVVSLLSCSHYVFAPDGNATDTRRVRNHTRLSKHCSATVTVTMKRVKEYRNRACKNKERSAGTRTALLMIKIATGFLSLPHWVFSKRPNQMPLSRHESKKEAWTRERHSRNEKKELVDRPVFVTTCYFGWFNKLTQTACHGETQEA
ncbi:hypothetical protein BCR43DRAFT_486348 [Syncephalastrum racemosum]|uniref:Secreted protein n=1 Tax=Syncephalastrum racemosum TaxID=13706 RepID=A0A1X2HP58_SYNRA|nr:hypothetical protein BCR43DRAFT_486348 [Syncephalastrum racemosum]